MARAEDLHSAKRRFTFQWKIMHLDMFGGVQGKELISPKFTVRVLDNSEWFLKLVLNEDMKSAMCFLLRTDSGPENSKISYILSAGSSYSVELQTFGKNSSSAMPGIINIYELAQKGDQILAKDVLVECHLFQSDNDFFRARDVPTSPYPVFCSTRTVISCDQRNFFLPVEYFSTSFEGLIKSFQVESADNNLNFICELSKVSYTTLGMEYRMKFLNADPQGSTTFVLKYRIQLVDALKRRHILLSGRLVSNSVNNGEAFLVPTSMLEKKNLYLPGKMILLSYEFAVSDNKAVSFIESTRYDSSDIQATNSVCSWGVYLDHKYNEHRFLFRLLAFLVLIFSLIIPHLFTHNSL